MKLKLLAWRIWHMGAKEVDKTMISWIDVFACFACEDEMKWNTNEIQIGGNELTGCQF